jgi:hypothetical protein
VAVNCITGGLRGRAIEVESNRSGRGDWNQMVLIMEGPFEELWHAGMHAHVCVCVCVCVHAHACAYWGSNQGLMREPGTLPLSYISSPDFHCE